MLTYASRARRKVPRKRRVTAVRRRHYSAPPVLPPRPTVKPQIFFDPAHLKWATLKQQVRLTQLWRHGQKFWSFIRIFSIFMICLEQGDLSASSKPISLDALFAAQVQQALDSKKDPKTYAKRSPHLL